MDSTTRIVIGVAGLLFLLAYVAWKWRRAGAYVAAREAFQERGRENFLALKQHPLTQTMLERLQQRYRVSWDPPPDGETYRLVWLALLDDQATCYRVEHADRASMLVAYLGREAPPKQLQVAMMLQTGELHETVPPYGWSLQAPDY